MIVFDLRCRDGGETFEAWFGSNADFERQRCAGLVCCPLCGSASVEKAPMAPNVSRKRFDSGAVRELARMQERLLENSRWVGDRFAETARAMHSGELASAAVHGRATGSEARALIQEGVPVALLPLPVVPPSDIN